MSASSTVIPKTLSQRLSVALNLPKSRKRLSKITSHKGIRIISAGWTFFTLENLILSHNRTEIIEKIGESGYHMGYNTLSSAACLSIAYGYFRHGRRQGPVIFQNINAPALRVASVLFTGLGMVGMAQVLPKFRNPGEMLMALGNGGNRKSLCPMDFESDKLNASNPGPYGISRITRHGSLWSFAFLSFGLGSLRSRFAAEFCLFAYPLFLVIPVLSWHKDFRYRNGIGGEPIKEAMEWPYSSQMPFLACVFGQQKVMEAMREMKPVNSMVALGLTGIIGLRKIKAVV